MGAIQAHRNREVRRLIHMWKAHAQRWEYNTFPRHSYNSYEVPVSTTPTKSGSVNYTLSIIDHA